MDKAAPKRAIKRAPEWARARDRLGGSAPASPGPSSLHAIQGTFLSS